MINIINTTSTLNYIDIIQYDWNKINTMPFPLPLQIENSSHKKHTYHLTIQYTSNYMLSNAVDAYTLRDKVCKHIKQ